MEVSNDAWAVEYELALNLSTNPSNCSPPVQPAALRHDIQAVIRAAGRLAHTGKERQNKCGEGGEVLLIQLEC